MKAVILAAGKGRRLEPLTFRRPKPMIPVANKPLLEHVVEAVVEAGVDEIVLVVGYERNRIQTHFGDGEEFGVDISYATQEKQLGTGHAVLQAESHVEEPFLVLNGDRILDPSLVRQFLDAELAPHDASVAVTRSTEPSEYGVVSLDGDVVTEISEKPRPSARLSELINAGVYTFDSRIFDVLRDVSPDASGEIALTSALEALIGDGSVGAIRYDGQWIDVSYPWDVPRVTTGILDRYGGGIVGDVAESAVVNESVAVAENASVGENATVLEGTSIGTNVRIGANAVLANAVVLRDATIGPGAVLRDCVVGANATVGANVTISGGNSDVVIDGEVYENVDFGGAVGDNARVGAGSVLRPGTIVGDGSTTEEATVLSGYVDHGAEVRQG